MAKLNQFRNILTEILQRPRKNEQKRLQQRKTRGLSDDMRKSVGKLKKKEFIYKKEVTRTITITCKLPLSFSLTQNRKTPRWSAH